MGIFPVFYQPIHRVGKLGQGVLVSYIWREPLFPPQREASAPFFGEKKVTAKFTKRSPRKISQNGAPAKSYSTQNTGRIYQPASSSNLPIPAKLPIQMGTTSRRSSWAFLAGKNKFDQENFYKTFYGENVPEKPLQTHRDKPSSIIFASSVMTMGIFP